MSLFWKFTSWAKIQGIYSYETLGDNYWPLPQQVIMIQGNRCQAEASEEEVRKGVTKQVTFVWALKDEQEFTEWKMINGNSRQGYQHKH